MLYAEDVGGVTEAFYRRDNNGTEMPLMLSWRDTGPITLPAVGLYDIPMPADTTMIDISFDLVFPAATPFRS